MANTIRLKRSSMAGKAPAAADLLLGELAINTTDGKLYLKKSDAGEFIVEVGPVTSVAGRTGVVTLAKADVGLLNVDNTSDAAKPVSTATQTALNGKANAMHSHGIADVTSLQTTLDAKAPLASPAFTGTPTAPTQTQGNNSTRLATTAYVDALGATKSNTAHAHVIADVTNLQTSLDAKAPAQNPVFLGTVDLASGSLRQNVVAVTALAMDCAAGNYFTKTIAADSAFTFANVPAAKAYSLTLELTHTAGNITWPVSVVWPSGIAPQLTIGRKHLFVFLTDDGGTVWRAAALADYLN
jgi:hypothetical protein